MKTVLISIVSGALMIGFAAAQNVPTPAPSSPSPEAQAPAQTPGTAPQTSPSPASPAPQAQGTQATPPQPGGAPQTAGAPKRIAPGSVLPVTLTKTIDAKKAKTGDEVIAKVTQDMKTNSGDVIVTKDTKIMGHVTAAQARSKEQKESQVAIAFDRAVAKDGSEMRMPMAIQAIIGSQSEREGSGENESGNSPKSGSSGSTPSTRTSGTTGATNQSATGSTDNGTREANATEANGKGRPPITAQTEGVVGISDLKLVPAVASADQSSTLSSQKNNVKLESGTLMLLRVN